MNTNKKTVRGMTLVEIIIAMFVFSVTAFILVQVGTTINALSQNASHVNKKTKVEAPLVENGEHIIFSKVEGDAEKLTIQQDDMEAVDGKLRITINFDDKKGHKEEINIAGKAFTVAKAAESDATAKTNFDMQYIYVSKNLKAGKNLFVDIESADTPAAP